MLWSWMYFATSSVLPVWPSSWGYWAFSCSLSATARLNRWGLSWISITPGSQYIISRSMLLMEMSPTPFRNSGSQKMPFTPVPCLSLRHQVSLYTCSYSACSSSTGRILESTLAVCSSSAARGSTLGSG